jgi:nitrate/TMAO reductase-like tetraheme cytochrome c subunit
MGMLMPKRPTTGQEFSAGIHVEEASGHRVQAQCPHCGLSHSWRTGKAHLADRIAPSQLGALGKAL